MNPKDGLFLGLLALAYLYVDATSTPGPMSDDAHTPAPSPSGEPADPSRLLPVPVARALPAKVVPRDVCPRDQRHAVALRPDGAMWCRGCDEAFYPQVTIWDSIMPVVAA